MRPTCRFCRDSVAAIKTAHTKTIAPIATRLAEAARLERELSAVLNAAYSITPEEEALIWRTAPPRMPISAPASLDGKDDSKSAAGYAAMSSHTSDPVLHCAALLSSCRPACVIGQNSRAGNHLRSSAFICGSIHAAVRTPTLHIRLNAGAWSVPR